MSVLRDIAVYLCGFVLLRLCEAQIIQLGPCPDVQVMQNFDGAKYLGKWYEAEKYVFIFQIGGKCTTAFYDQKENGLIGVVNSQINSLSGLSSTIKGEANQVSRSDEGKLAVRFPSLPIDIAAPYWVVDTDYDNYSLVWSCYDFGIFHTENAWILTRKRNPQSSVIEKAYEVAKNNNINRINFIPTNQKNCPDE